MFLGRCDACLVKARQAFQSSYNYRAHLQLCAVLLNAAAMLPPFAALSGAVLPCAQLLLLVFAAIALLRLGHLLVHILQKCLKSQAE